ncbi:hypothetical protein BJX63DRAFT_69251 [Aspergillus granulosus]|uniref:Secreted protein n=1 Tax=Aspergillus granulosus TaxID=176169 RepID=A0ABR4HS17_9EURO
MCRAWEVCVMLFFYFWRGFVSASPSFGRQPLSCVETSNASPLWDWVPREAFSSSLPPLDYAQSGGSCLARAVIQETRLMTFVVFKPRETKKAAKFPQPKQQAAIGQPTTDRPGSASTVRITSKAQSQKFSCCVTL